MYEDDKSSDTINDKVNTQTQYTYPMVHHGPRNLRALKVISVLVSVAFFGVCIMAVVAMIFASSAKSKGITQKKKVQKEALQGALADEIADQENQPENQIQLQSPGRAIITDVTEVVREAMPTVVSIYSTYEVKENFWGYSFSSEETGSGSGIIVGENEEELLIATNQHVVADSSALTVQFIDDAKAEAVVKGSNKSMDLAVIAVKLENLSKETKDTIRVALLGDSTKCQVGEAAIAIGNALGYGQSVTTGVVSAINRSYETGEDGNKSLWIQTDAAINPGNSGGALLNAMGEVIGINSSKIAGTKVEGMGYAIPISVAKPIIDELMLKETKEMVAESERGYLGISGINVTEDISSVYGLPCGVYLAKVYPYTPAEQAGLKKGDVLISMNGEPILSMEDLTEQLKYTKAGTTAVLEIMVNEGDGYVQQKIEVALEARQ